MSVTVERRKSNRVEFSRGIDVQMVAIDGTWRRSCVMLDVAAGGAKLAIAGKIEGISLKEFFLVLSTTGHAFRRCQLAWINGERLGVRFLDTRSKSRKAA
ncbi:MAG TPA: PilZ domain-containing protein [Bradyrhizobium sp.]|nr:PilZ domain-containing protein [Bradyrhizobium sp.]